MLNWKIFGVKYDKRENFAFESLSYLLFCAEFDNRIGLFRFKNQTGIETEPIEIDEKIIGFQAKYYGTNISSNKDDLIDSIRKAKQKNPTLNTLLFYLNQEFSESSSITKKKPSYLTKIEDEAKKLSITIEWRVPSHFEIQLYLPENAYIFDLFFKIELSSGDFIDSLKNHSQALLKSIQSHIVFKSDIIKIDRSIEIDKIKIALSGNQSLIISGEGGCGKTAIIKELYNDISSKTPFYIFKATELNVGHLNDIFRLSHNFTFEQFIDAHKDEKEKILVIDSAEKLSEIENTDILISFITRLQTENWRIIFTTRYAYLNDLQFHLLHIYRIHSNTINISLLNNEELDKLSLSYKFALPTNEKFKDRLTNLFYLNEYLCEYESINKNKDFSSFIDVIWRRRIQDNIHQTNNLHLERERSFLYLVKKRCDSGLFYINADKLPPNAISKLVQDEVIGYNENLNGYFITHDIYEEWALGKIIGREFVNRNNDNEFYKKIGESLPIRRAFRIWISEKLGYSIESVKEFIINSFLSSQIPVFWKDELVVSILLSNYSALFFDQLENEIVADDFKLLNRIIFLLRIACKEIDNADYGLETTNNYVFTKPKGNGWKSVIKFISIHKNEYLDNHLDILLPLFNDWVKYEREGESTRSAGLMALSIIKKRVENKDLFIHKDIESEILQIINYSAKMLLPELGDIFQTVIDNKWTRHRDPYNELCSEVLTNSYKAAILIQELPFYIIKLCDLFWYEEKNESNDYYDGFGTEKYYSIKNHIYNDYYPSSALQTPIFWLLRSKAFYETIDFIIDFTNKTVDSFTKSRYGDDIEEVTLYIDNEKEQKQYINRALWEMYRGTGTPVVPHLLESIHMALEKVLLDFSKKIDKDASEKLLIHILTKSKSASLTSIVCSIVLANPDKFSNIALVLFKTLQLFHYDTIRCINESQAKTLYSIGSIPQKEFFTKERLQTCDDKHRSISLESLIVNYQLFGIFNIKEENEGIINNIHSIIDQHKDNIKVNQKEFVLGILLARIDRRTMSPTIKKDGNNFLIELNPRLSPELEKQSEQATESFNSFMKYTPLKLWSMYKFEEKEDSKKFPQFEDNVQNVIIGAKEILCLIEKQSTDLNITDDYIPSFACSALIRFYNDKLSIEELSFCKKVVTNRILDVIDDKYKYQIFDGVEASIHSIPTLIRLFPQEKDFFKQLLLLIILDTNKIAEYKRICDYVIEAFANSTLWVDSSEDPKSFVFAYIHIKPIYNKYLKDSLSKNKDRWGQRRVSKQTVIEKVNAVIKKIDFNYVENASFGVLDLPIEDLEVIFNLIPSNTQDQKLLSIIEQILTKISLLLIPDKEHKNSRYKIRIQLFRKFSFFILNREVSVIPKYLAPFLNKLDASEETEQFIGAIVYAEDSLCKQDQFWKIWELLYNQICKECKYGYYSSQVLIDYLLAWRWWNRDIKDWHSLKKENLSFYEKISKDLGSNPAVLYSIARVLNTIGSNFITEGVDWLYNIISENINLPKSDLESDTIYYLDQLMRKYIFQNKEHIKRDIKIKNKVIPILDYMIEKGSVQGYLLRESIL